eukprot:5371420-Prymnesium_polylepis.1
MGSLNLLPRGLALSSVRTTIWYNCIVSVVCVRALCVLVRLSFASRPKKDHVKSRPGLETHAMNNAQGRYQLLGHST